MKFKHIRPRVLAEAKHTGPSSRSGMLIGEAWLYEPFGLTPRPEITGIVRGKERSFIFTIYGARYKKNKNASYYTDLMRALICLGMFFSCPAYPHYPFLVGIAIFKRLYRAEVMIEGPPQGHRLLGNFERRLLIHAAHHGRIYSQLLYLE